MIDQEVAIELRGILYEAVQEALHAVPGNRVGAVLSGGVDSSTVVALAGRMLPTFTGYYEGANEEFDERRYAYMVHGMPHHEILITPEDFVENFDDMAAAAEPPYQGMGTFGQYMVAKYIREKGDVDVVLSGEGSDELFGGYARLLKVAGEKAPDGYANYKQPEGYPKSLKAALKYDWDRLPDLLAVDEQMMAAHGLQALAPFTDSRVVDFVLVRPDEERVNKRLLKAAVAQVVPQAILERTDKKGFPIPLVAWANQEPVKSFVTERLGYAPDPKKPWDRAWWVELIEKAKTAVPA